MDTKAAFDRKAFETWVAEEMGHTVEYVKGQRAVCVDRYYNEYIEIPYRAWKASRAALEIELEPLSDQYFASDIKNSFEHGRETERKATVQVLTSHGIRIKGKTE